MQITRHDLADEIAFRMTGLVDADDLADYYYQRQFEYYKKTAQDDELRNTAIDLAIIDSDEDLTITD